MKTEVKMTKWKTHLELERNHVNVAHPRMFTRATLTWTRTLTSNKTVQRAKHKGLSEKAARKIAYRKVHGTNAALQKTGDETKRSASNRTEQKNPRQTIAKCRERGSPDRVRKHANDRVSASRESRRQRGQSSLEESYDGEPPGTNVYSRGFRNQRVQLIQEDVKGKNVYLERARNVNTEALLDVAQKVDAMERMNDADCTHHFKLLSLREFRRPTF